MKIFLFFTAFVVYVTMFIAIFWKYNDGFRRTSRSESITMSFVALLFSFVLATFTVTAFKAVLLIALAIGAILGLATLIRYLGAKR